MVKVWAEAAATRAVRASKRKKRRVNFMMYLLFAMFLESFSLSANSVLRMSQYIPPRPPFA
jgi:hypothetical protein